MFKNLLFSALFFSISFSVFSQKSDDHRVIVIMTDGFRWQDMFGGMDSSLVKLKRFHHGDSAAIVANYWAKDLKDRREKLLPFFWKTIAQKGQLHGNRQLGNLANVSNPYWFSYPGYSELLTGQVDTAVNSNDYKANPNTNFFEYLNSLPNYKNQVAAFGAWDAFDRILNEKRAGFPVINGFDDYSSISNSVQAKLLSAMTKESFHVFGEVEVLDLFMHYQALDYLKTQKPKALFISYGETDEFAHEGHYGHYLNAAHQFDAWVSDIWNFVETDPLYKGKTTLLITTDHGRGNKIKSQWTSHGQEVKDSHEIWFALLGAKVEALGEVKSKTQVYQKDLIHRVSQLMGLNFQSEKK
ncbi:phosphoglyceromutase [Aquirufa sp. ROCK2-A2]